MMHTWRRWWSRRWQALWFTPAPALNLAAARMIFAAHALWLLLSRDLPALSGLPTAFWAHVPASVHWRYLLWEGHPHLEQGLQSIAIVALGAAIIGVWPRLACFVAGLCLYHLAPLETIIWNPMPWGRGFTVSVLALLTLAFSRCGDALCLGRRRAVPSSQSLAPDYNWPLRLVQLFLCQIYFFAGYSKFFSSGWGWSPTDNVRGWLLLLNHPDAPFAFTSLGPWLAERSWLCMGLALGTLAMELSFLTVPFWQRARAWLLPIALTFHLGTVFSMSIAFLNAPQLLIFVDWDALARRCRARSAPWTS